jgi:hypothetical protein
VQLRSADGFACADSFAEYMAADYDSNNDGLIDADAIRYVQGESEAAYVNKIVVTYRSTLRDANTKFVNASTSFDYIQSDNTHPTYTAEPSVSASSAARARARAHPTTAARRSSAARTRCGTSSGTSAWVGLYRSSTRPLRKTYRSHRRARRAARGSAPRRLVPPSR